MVEDQRAPAGIVLRGVAYLIDCVIVFAIFAASQLTLFAMLRSRLELNERWFQSGLNTECYTLITISLPVYLYFAILESSPWQATIGKRLMGITMVNVATDSRPLFYQSFLRIVIKLLPWELAHVANNLPTPIWYTDEPEFRIAFVFSGLLMGFYVASILVSRQRIAPHDWIAGTRSCLA